ncbi:hypothetical protein Y032_0032g2462 [Ancylostoma ceylanicum]|uniref:Uncharacterized protein n=1 Tax=Ancylostoma ceylanicum TaxID=53326 RepID=A0A016UPD6_9BILA|nr:hypothetical protein Y032_0032g2462 [Ancylostoma ceylanicum]
MVLQAHGSEVTSQEDSKKLPMAEWAVLTAGSYPETGDNLLQRTCRSVFQRQERLRDLGTTGAAQYWEPPLHPDFFL